MAKQKAKKKKAKVTANMRLRAKRKSKRKPRAPKGLFEKKLAIMAAYPIVPTSVLSKDKYGSWYPYTRAEEIFYKYSKACREHRLVIRTVKMQVELLQIPPQVPAEGKQTMVDRYFPLCLATGTYEIRDLDSGETEQFMASGLGDNQVWAANSAQTVAKKQGLIEYFFTAWPQQENYASLIREDLNKIEDFETFK